MFARSTMLTFAILQWKHYVFIKSVQTLHPSPGFLSQIYHEGIRYARCSIALSDDSFQLVCISIAILKKDTNWRVCIDLHIYQSILRTWREHIETNDGDRNL